MKRWWLRLLKPIIKGQIFILRVKSEFVIHTGNIYLDLQG